MISEIEKLPDDAGKLKEIIVNLHNDYQQKTVRHESRIAILEEQIAILQARLFAPRSEKLRAEYDLPAQMSLFDLLDEVPTASLPEATEEKIEVPSHHRRKRGRRPLPDNLPREEVVHDIPEADKVCACGCPLTRIGEEVSEQLHIGRPVIKVIRNIRPKYACRACEGTDSGESAVRIAPVPLQIIPKSFATAALLAHIIIGKFADSLPLYRQEVQFARLGVDLSRATMANWMVKVADKCQPLLLLLRQEIRSGPLINADETTLQVMNEAGRANTTKSYVWIFRGGSEEKPAVIFSYHPTRSGRAARDFLTDYRGYVQCDGFKGYDQLEKIEGLTLLGCWAHARRKFVEVVKAGGKGRKPGKMRAADVAVRYIRRLYAIEKDAKELNPEERYRLRQEKARPILDDFGLWLRQNQPKAPPQSGLGQAINYTLQQWKRLNVYIENGLLRPDNNLAENAIRPFVVGRKNWLFSGSPDGAHASATLYTLIETAKMNRLDPYKYIRYLLENIPQAGSEEDFKKLLPTQVTKKQLKNFFADQ